MNITAESRNKDNDEDVALGSSGSVFSDRDGEDTGNLAPANPFLGTTLLDAKGDKKNTYERRKIRAEKAWETNRESTFESFLKNRYLPNTMCVECLKIPPTPVKLYVDVKIVGGRNISA